MIKPILAKKIEEVVRKAINLLRGSNHFFEYKSRHSKYKIPIKDIVYFGSDSKKVKVFLLENEYEFYGKLSDIKQELNNLCFILIHKSYLVNYLHVIEYEYDYVKMSNEAILPISQQNRKLVHDKLLQYKQRSRDNEFKLL